ncbi:transcription antitermination factor NusB [bacterium]|nr:transcription antitermination factor NusB [bacterium]
MGKRSTGRKLAMQILYQADVRDTSVDQILECFWEMHHFEPDTVSWATDLSTRTWSYRDDIDQLIQKYAIGWELNRMNPIDKAVLRLSFYELIHDGEDPGIVINEAIEICKKYASDESPRFVNGILGQYIKQCSLES